MESLELRSIVESLIFTAPRPVTLEQLQDWLEDATKDELVSALDAIRRDFDQPERGLRLVEVAEGFQFRTPKQNGPWVRKTLEVKPLRLSQAALEVLSIVAYKQPVTRAEVESVRGVDSSHLLKSLMERDLICLEGKTDDPGRPLLYATTDQFLEMFSIKSIRDLPTLRDLQELTAFGESPEVEPTEAEEGVAESEGTQQLEDSSDIVHS
jgi:segregation and condensation protein B